MNTMQCKICKVEKPFDDFYNDSSTKCGKSHLCKKCASEYQRKYNRENRQMITEKSRVKKKSYKHTLIKENGGKCCICGYNRYVGALNFHHKDPSQKEIHVSVTGINKAREEAKKCILVCANCHAEIHGGITPIPL